MLSLSFQDENYPHIVDTGPVYPTNRLTISLGDMKNVEIDYLEIYMVLNNTFDIELMLDDSLR